MASPGGQILNLYKWNHIQLAKFGTNASGILFSWRDNSSYRLLPWVRCASGNVLKMFMKTFDAQNDIEYIFLLWAIPAIWNLDCTHQDRLAIWHTAKSDEGERGKKEGFQLEALHWKHGSTATYSAAASQLLNHSVPQQGQRGSPP